jgi:hypothetical protein
MNNSFDDGVDMNYAVEINYYCASFNFLFVYHITVAWDKKLGMMICFVKSGMTEDLYIL